MKFYLIYFALDLPKSIRTTLMRGGLLIIALTAIEYVWSLMFGATDKSAGKDVLNFLTDAAFYLMALCFLMIFVPRFISKVLFLMENRNNVTDPFLLHKLWEWQ